MSDEANDQMLDDLYGDELPDPLLVDGQGDDEASTAVQPPAAPVIKPTPTTTPPTPATSATPAPAADPATIDAPLEVKAPKRIDEVAADPSQKVPLAELVKHRRAARDLRLRVAELEAERSIRTAASGAGREADPFPRQAELDEIQNLIEQDEPLSAKQARTLTELTAARLKHEAAQEAKVQQAVAGSTAGSAVRLAHQTALEEWTVDQCGEGLDYATVWREGFANLSDADKAAIEAAGEEAAGQMYTRCIQRTPALYSRYRSRASSVAASTGAPAPRSPAAPPASPKPFAETPPVPVTPDVERLAEELYGDDEEAALP
ncbi:MAG: hypothetical protein PHU85_17075 [Phycisphaerae bacterium]|nr:hypothetical protein [Phycisphaerae bacterium]